MWNMTPTRLPLALRNLIFVILQPGIVAGAIPYIIAKKGFSNAMANTFLFYHYLGILTFLVGLFMMFHCIIKFAIDGRGTLSPADPTKRLVISGLYRFSRNPMYIGVMMILLGEAIFTQSLYLCAYSIIVLITFNLFILFKEEPRLKKDFSKAYEEYCKTVRRWI